MILDDLDRVSSGCAQSRFKPALQAVSGCALAAPGAGNGVAAGLWNAYPLYVQSAEATVVVRKFGQYPNMVEAGQSIRMAKQGRPVARLVPDRDFMSGKEAAELFRGYKAEPLDNAAAEEIARKVRRLDAETDDALAH
jgi:antitoxin (DNA-binding transcriptional repressor) of toxin-antitoxin stability system